VLAQKDRSVQMRRVRITGFFSDLARSILVGLASFASLSRSNDHEEEQAAPPAFDPFLYPATYRPSVIARVVSLLAIPGIFSLHAIGRGHLIQNGSSWHWGMFFVLLGFAILAALNFISERIILYADRIESKACLGKRVMRRGDIEGLRSAGVLQTTYLYHTDNPTISFSIPYWIEKDAAWKAWIVSVPDLDALDEKKILADEKGYPRLGTTSQQRERNWDITNKSAMICCWTTIVMLPVVLVPYLSLFAAAVLIIIPWIVLANMHLYGVIFSTVRARNPITGNSITLIFSGMGLGLFGLFLSGMPGAYYVPQEGRQILLYIAGPACGLILLVPTLRVFFSKSQWRDTPTRIPIGILLAPWMVLFDWGYGIGTAFAIKTMSGY
jgi:hypothetical protein